MLSARCVDSCIAAVGLLLGWRYQNTAGALAAFAGTVSVVGRFPAVAATDPFVDLAFAAPIDRLDNLAGNKLGQMRRARTAGQTLQP